MATSYRHARRPVLLAQRRSADVTLLCRLVSAVPHVAYPASTPLTAPGSLLVKDIALDKATSEKILQLSRLWHRCPSGWISVMGARPYLRRQASRPVNSIPASATQQTASTPCSSIMSTLTPGHSPMVYGSYTRPMQYKGSHNHRRWSLHQQGI